MSHPSGIDRPRPVATSRGTLLRVLFIGALALLVIEAVGQVLQPAGAQEPAVGAAVLPWTPHHYLSYVNTPNYRQGGTSHNSRGFRGPEVVVPKPRGVTRIVLLGGSNVYTSFVERDEETLSAQLQNVLREEYGYKNAEVVNGGVDGYTSWESLLSLQFSALDLQPDVVMFCLSINDVHARLVEPASYRADNRGRRKVWTAAPSLVDRVWTLRRARLLFGSAVEASLDRLLVPDTAFRPNRRNVATTDPMKMLDENRPIYLRRNLRSIAAITRTAGARILFTTAATSPLFGDYAATPYYQRGVQENNAVVREIGQQLDVPVIERESLMPDDKQYWIDGRHLSPSGARLMAQMFAEFLAETGMGRRETTTMDEFMDLDDTPAPREHQR